MEIFHLKSELKDLNTSVKQKSIESTLKTQLKEEIQKNKELILKISELENLLIANSVKIPSRDNSPCKRVTNLEEWEFQREDVLRDLESKTEKIINLEMELDESKENYQNLEINLSNELNYLRETSMALGQNLETVTASYNHLAREKAEIAIKKQSYERKIVRLTKRVKSSEEELRKLKEIQILVKQDNSRESDKCKEKINSENRVYPPKLIMPKINRHGTIKKTIKGGGGYKSSETLQKLESVKDKNIKVIGGIRRSFATMQILEATKDISKDREPPKNIFENGGFGSPSSKEGCEIF